MSTDDCTAVGTALGIRFVNDCCKESAGMITCNQDNRITLLNGICTGDPNQIWANQPFPKGLEAATQLQVIILSQCNFTGPLPDTWAPLQSLYELHIDGNQLTGPIPPSLGTVPSLQYLHLSNNNFEGALPDTFTQLTQIQVVELQGNCLTAGVGNIATGEQRSSCAVAGSPSASAADTPTAADVTATDGSAGATGTMAVTGGGGTMATTTDSVASAAGAAAAAGTAVVATGTTSAPVLSKSDAFKHLSFSFIFVSIAAIFA
ncbi:hypothetical protein CcCBS67573_g07598 [Chytriomyces confervae]|uniref:L domain-like protein n=1 Tax=Chytriomyces confervae TaxID=246404 RepID=A0A507ETE2_9FUNG|nr:hypothetical protein HDU80_001246 [Chytriomyces hyalinus]TPX67151.1 hypothetical protein CcCBS67573_g07598 [Chytriomyces confervae]